MTERLSQGEQLQHAPFGVRQLTESQRHKLHQATRGPKRSQEAADPSLVHEHACVQRPENELAQDHRIALATIGELPHRRRVHGLPESRDEQLFDSGVVEDLHLDALGGAVLPQSHDCIRRRLARAHRGEHRRGAGHGELVEQGRRAVVEQVGVVHENDEGPVPGFFDDGPRVTAQQLARVPERKAVATLVWRQDRGEGPEGQTPRGTSGSRAGKGHPVVFGHLESPRCKRCLADSRRADDHRPPSFEHGGGQPVELVAPADQRPTIHDRV